MSVQVALDLGGTTIKAALVSGGTIIASGTLAAHSSEGLGASLPAVEHLVASLLKERHLSPGSISGVGIAFAGPVDAVHRRVVSTNAKFDDAPTLDFEAWVRRAWSTTVAIDNDARLACLGEWKYGAGAGRSNVVTVTLGTGIGSGVVIQGRLLRGAHFQAGSLGGHIPVDVSSGALCTCGNIGCAESVASTWAFRRDLAAMGEKARRQIIGDAAIARSGLKELFTAAGRGIGVAVQLHNRYLRAWGAALVGLVHAYDPEIVILTGGVVASGSALIEELAGYVHGHAWTPGWSTEIVGGRHPDTAALLGAAYLAGGDSIEVI